MTEQYTVPAEMRDFADRSVQQARKAFEGFIGAVKKSTGAVESMTGSASVNLTGASSKAVDIAEKNVSAAFDLAEKLVHAKDIQEVMSIQSEYLKAQMAALQDQTREFGEAFVKSITPNK